MAGRPPRTESRQEARVFTGIDPLDRILGGIPSGSVVIVSGRLGSGFDILVQQILYTGASTGFAPVIYANVDRPTEDITSEMTAKGWDVNTLLEDKRWTFADAYTARLNVRKGVSGPKVLSDFFANLPGKLVAGSWSAVDSLSSFAESQEFKEVSASVEDLVSDVREKGGIHFLLLVEGFHEPRVATRLAHSVDGLFTVSLDPLQTEPFGSIRVEKLRHTHHIARNIPFRITSTGIMIETSVRIGSSARKGPDQAS